MRHFVADTRTVVMVLATVIAQVSATRAGDPSASDGVLTVEETLGTVFILQIEGGPPWHLYKNANPEAKEALYPILANKEAERYHANAWRILGYIGDDSDVKKLEDAVRGDYSGALTGWQRRSMEGAFDCLGLMSARNIASARECVDRMCKPDYWSRVEFTWYPANLQRDPPGFVYETISRVIRGYNLAGKEAAEKAASVLGAIREPGLAEYMKLRIDPARLGKAPDPLRASAPVSPMERKVAVGLYGRMAKRFLGDEEVEEAERAFVMQATKEARDAFEKLKSDLVRGEIEGLVPNLLDNGRVIDEEKAKRVAAELSRDLQREQQVFESLAEIETEPGDYKVSRDASYEFPSVGKEGMPVGVTKKEAVTVTFKLTGSAEVGRVFFRRNRGSLTVAGDGTLIVVMKKIDGKWYWNPFGW